MSDTSTLLPPNATAPERALDGATSRLSDVPVPLRTLWNADTCPANLLAWLAWAYGVDEWQESWPEQTKRETIRSAIDVQMHKGTLGSIRRVLESAGYPGATLLEGRTIRKYDGSVTYDGFHFYGWAQQWARYRAKLEKPITNAQAAQVRRIMETTAPARCHLVDFVFTQAANAYNGAINYDGTYNHGTV